MATIDIDVPGEDEFYKVAMLVHHGWRKSYDGWKHPEGLQQVRYEYHAKYYNKVEKNYDLWDNAENAFEQLEKEIEIKNS